MANRPTAKLSDTGELLTGAALTGGKTAEENYTLYCANCHGAEGKGNGPGATAEPAPRDFTDTSWQNSTTDERIATVITKGGPAVGLSATMAPWGAVLKASEVEDMVKYVRQFNK
jgi:mono/diheme cytochrome c family protein